MKDLTNAKHHLKNNMSWCATSNCSNCSKNNTDKTFHTIPKNKRTKKAWTAAINRKAGTFSKNVCLCSNHFEEACFDKSWTLQAQLFYTSRPKKRKLADGSVSALT